MVKKIVFRVDASLQIGTGHVMRCLTLADALREQGADICFLTREHPGNLIAAIQQKGYQAYSLPLVDDVTTAVTHSSPLAHAQWLGATQQQDALACGSWLQQFQPDWMIIDHYALDSVWQGLLKPYYKKLMVIDDLADRQQACDILLDQSYGRELSDYQSLVPSSARLLLGTDYALLRPEFAQWRDFSLKRRVVPELRQLLITMGGVDADNATGRVLTALKACGLPDDLRIAVVMGATAPWLQQVKQQALTMPRPTEVKVNISNMAELMAKSDVVIGAAGSTSWERCCLGLPTLMVVLAENQKFAAHLLNTSGAAITMEISDPTSFAGRINECLGDRERLAKVGAIASKVVDGGGVARVMATL